VDMQVAKGVLKAKMLEFFRNVEKTGEELIVTDNNKPVLKILPYKKKTSPDELFADLRGKMRIKGDINEPALKPEEWNVLK
ncbi:MAG: type II toxin-antitoxin system Phd/YefM family antitoxin, partial [Candidatus Anammoxibacter sp.]